MPQSRYHYLIVEQLDALLHTHFILIVDNAFTVSFLGRDIARDYELLTIEEFGRARRNATQTCRYALDLARGQRDHRPTMFQTQWTLRRVLGTA